MKLLKHILILIPCLVCLVSLAGCKKGEESLDWKSMNEQWLAYNLVRYKDSTKFHVSSSGLQYYIECEGDKNASHPNSGSTVYVQYKGKLIDGHVFDRSTGSTLTVSSTVSGFAEGLRKMYPGGRAVLFIPAHLAYAENGSGTMGYDSYIPPYSVLIFEVTLKGWQN